MMKPLTLFSLACLLTTQAQGAEPQVSAAAPTASSAVSVAESAIASPPAASAAEWGLELTLEDIEEEQVPEDPGRKGI